MFGFVVFDEIVNCVVVSDLVVLEYWEWVSGNLW